MKMITYFLCSCLIVLFASVQALAQFNISDRDFPSAIGTLIITEDDTVNQVEVNVGYPGMNQTWRLNQPIPGILTRQQIVDPDSTPFRAAFPEANFAIRYVGSLGNIVHSVYFDDIYGEFYAYQTLSPNDFKIHGFASKAAFAHYNEYYAKFKGSVNIQPDILLHSLPLRYGKSWNSDSEFSVEVDTLLLSQPIKIKATIKNNVNAIVDGFGTLILPTSSYRCLRVKIYLTLEEKIDLNGMPLRSKKTRTINYYWVAQKYGIVARVISYCNEADDNFVKAKQVSRLHMFDPKVGFALENLRGRRGTNISMPIYVSDVTDLNITSVQMKVAADVNILKPLGVSTTGTLTAAWTTRSFTITSDGIVLNLKGEKPLTGQGVLCYVNYQVNPNAPRNGATDIKLQNIVINERGPSIYTRDGRFNVLPGTLLKPGDDLADLDQTPVPGEFRLMQNYPNPFNPETTIEYHLPQTAEVVLTIYDVQGQTVRNLIQGMQSAGIQSIRWDGRDETGQLAASGTYFYRVEMKAETNEEVTFVDIKKMTLMK